MPVFTVIKNHFHEKSLVIQTQITAGKSLIDLKQGGSFRPRDKYTIQIHDGHIYHPLGNDHITIDYYQSESIISVPFDCSCGSPHCKRYVGT
jgi:hypothetical protein